MSLVCYWVISLLWMIGDAIVLALQALARKSTTSKAGGLTVDISQGFFAETHWESPLVRPELRAPHMLETRPDECEICCGISCRLRVRPMRWPS